MKYVIYLNPEKPEGSKDQYVAVLTSEYITHKTTHSMVRENDTRVHRQGKYCKPLSAGFFKIEVVDGSLSVNTFGRSDSMELEPKDGDKDIIIASLTHVY
jgi:hypothetical protein